MARYRSRRESIYISKDITISNAESGQPCDIQAPGRRAGHALQAVQLRVLEKISKNMELTQNENGISEAAWSETAPPGTAGPG